MAVKIRDGGEVGLHGFFPATGGEHGGVVTRWLGHLHACGWNIGEIAFLGRWQLDIGQRMHVIVFLGHVPRHVRLVKTEGEEERLVMSLAEF